jgi:cold shock CspA family protein
VLTGEVKFFDEAKNHGFIMPHEDGPEVFFHRSTLQGTATLKAGQWVTFEVIPGYRHPKTGSQKAQRVMLCAKRGEYDRKKVVGIGAD